MAIYCVTHRSGSYGYLHSSRLVYRQNNLPKTTIYLIPEALARFLELAINFTRELCSQINDTAQDKSKKASTPLKWKGLEKRGFFDQLGYEFKMLLDEFNIYKSKDNDDKYTLASVTEKNLAPFSMPEILVSVLTIRVQSVPRKTLVFPSALFI